MQGVGEPGGARFVDGDQAVGLQALQGAGVEGVQVEGQGLGEGEAFEALALCGAGPVQDVGGAFPDRRGHRHPSPPGLPSGALDRHEQALVAHGGQQFAQQPQVAPAQAVQPVGGERFQDGVLGRREQFGGLLARQRLQRQARQQFPGPQPGHGAGHGGAVGGGDQEPGAAVQGELVDESGGGVVQQVRVVDQQQPYTGQEVQRAVQCDVVGEQMGEGGEGEVPGLGRPGRPGPVRAAHGLHQQPGLAAARRPRHHQAAASGGHRPAHQLQFVGPSGERPGRPEGLRVAQRSRRNRHDNMSRHTHP